MHLRPAFTRLLVLLLLLQWGTAFGHCLKLAAPQGGVPGGVLHMEICTPEGLRSITLTLDQDEPAPQDHAAGMLCPLCGGAAGATLPPPRMALVAPPLLAQAPSLAVTSTPNPAPPPRRQPPPRAPPAA